MRLPFFVGLRMCSSYAMTAKKACVLLANGCEEIEFVTSVDILRRAAIDTKVVSVTGQKSVKGAHQVTFEADDLLANVTETQFDAIVMPGGMGSLEAFQQTVAVADLLRKQDQAGRLIAAICAAPVALMTHSLCAGKSFTCYPSMEVDMIAAGYQYKGDASAVVCDGNLITSRGPGTAVDFALAIVENLLGKNAAIKLAKTMLINYA